MSISICRSAQLRALVLFGLVSAQAGAADVTTYGVGTGAISNGVEIYFPIRTASLIIEPRISYRHDEDKIDGTGSELATYPPSSSLPNSTTPITSRQDNSNENIEIGLGIFSKTQMTDEIEFYYGGRLGYLTDKRQYKQRNNHSAGGGYVYTSVYETDRKQTGYFLAPTVGIQYFPRPNFSLGIEIAFRYSDLSGHEDLTENQTNNDPTNSSSFRSESGNADTVTYRTLTSAIIRGYF